MHWELPLVSSSASPLGAEVRLSADLHAFRPPGRRYSQRLCARLGVVMSTRTTDRVAMLDAATMALAVGGVLLSNLIGLPPGAQLAQLVLIVFGLNTVILVLRDRRAASRQDKARTLQPTRGRMAAACGFMAFIVAIAVYASMNPGHGWIATGLLLIGSGASAQFLVEDSKLHR